MKYAYRIETRKVKEPEFPYPRDSFSNPSSIASFCNSLQDSDVEKVLVLHVDSRNRLNCIQVQPGTVNKAQVYIREIIKHSLLSGSTGIIIVHNHPSGHDEFSESDLKLTQRLKEAGAIMDVLILDHILLCGDGWYVSMSEQGLLP